MYIADQKDVRHLELLQLGEVFAEYGGQGLAVSVSKRGGDKNQFMKEIMPSVRDQSITGSHNEALGLSNFDSVAGYSISSALKAAYNRNWDRAFIEKAVSDLGTTKSGMVPNGFFVPFSMLSRDFSAGTANLAGNLIGSAINSSRAPDPLFKVSCLARMGATFIPGLRETLQLPRFISTSTVAAKSEVASSDTATEETSLAILTPKRYSVQMVISSQALIQSTPTLDLTIGRHWMKGIMSQIDYDALNADGTSNTPVGLRNTTGIGNVVGGINGAQLAWSHLVDLENSIDAADTEETELSGFIVNASTRKWLRKTQRGTNLPFIWDDSTLPLLGHRSAVSNILPNNLDKGTSTGVCSSICYSSDWSQLMVGLYGPGVDVTVDRITQADIGKVVITAAVLAGVGVNLPASFSAMNDALIA
jgi:hypothetical protein